MDARVTSASTRVFDALLPGHDEHAPHSTLAPLALMGAAHRSISLGTNFVRYSGVRRSGGGMVTPMLSKRSRTAGASTASFTALARCRTVSSGVPLGKESDAQLPQSRPERPCSCAVGRFSSPPRAVEPERGDGFDGVRLDLRQRGRDLLGDEV